MISVWTLLTLRISGASLPPLSVPDRALVEVTRSDVGHPTSINVKFSETLDEEAPDGDA